MVEREDGKRGSPAPHARDIWKIETSEEVQYA